MNTVKISLAAASSQGKTTLLDRLSRNQFLAEKNFRFGGSPVRDIQKLGIDINEAGTDITQALVVAKHIENAYKDGNWIFDRSIMDSLAYGIAARKRNMISAETLIFNETIFKSLINKYQIMFYIIPELPVIADGVRSLDKDYFDDVVNGFNYIIAQYGHEMNLVLISGTVDERCECILSHIKKLFD